MSSRHINLQKATPLEVLQHFWGHSSFREKQEEIISSVLNGHDTMGLLPTGGGQSICFQVPGLLLNGITLVITPLISLMNDQVDNLRSRGIKAATEIGLDRPLIIVCMGTISFSTFLLNA